MHWFISHRSPEPHWFQPSIELAIGGALAQPAAAAAAAPAAAALVVLPLLPLLLLLVLVDGRLQGMAGR